MERWKQRHNAMACPRNKEAGFTLIEMIVVTAILGMIAVILTISVSKAIKRQRLAVAAQQLQATINKAWVDVTQNRTGVFVVIGATAGDGTRTVQLVSDSNGDSKYTAGTDKVLESFIITSDLVLRGQAVGSNPAWPAGTGGVYVLLCDTMGRTIDPTLNPPGPPTTIPQIVSLTHAEMNATPATLTPRIRYDLSTDRLWQTSLSQPIKY